MSDLHRIFVQQNDIVNNTFDLKERKDTSYLRKVLRLSRGTRLIIFDGAGNEYLAELEIVSKGKVVGKIIKKLADRQQLVKFYLILAQALPRAGKLDTILRMNTEVGVSAFYLYECDYSLAKIGNYSAAKLARLQRVAQEAARQSERLLIPQIDAPITFKQVLSLPIENKILLHARQLKESVELPKLKSTLAPSSQVLLIIGPEGGFSAKELALAQKQKCQIAYLNLPILRTETAGVVASGILLA